MKSITTSIYTFEELIKEDFLYVDKTDFVYSLVAKTGHYFLSRPRRFGKSLLISTLKAVFQGKKDLFTELKISEKEYNWKPYPILHFNLGNCSVKNDTELKSYFDEELNRMAAEYDVELTSNTVAGCFSELIEALGKTEKVVILIDEYDKPILDNITQPEAENIREELSGFYGVIKGKEEKLRFTLLTGVSKFSQVSVFSKLNNLTDLTMAPYFSTALGYTQKELEKYFAENIQEIVNSGKFNKPILMKMLKKWYNGYLFNTSSERVYNPVSIGKFFVNNGEFVNYWFATGTPTFLLKLAREQQFNFEEALNTPLASLAFDSYEIGNLHVLPLLFQTGYLTIKDSFIDDFEVFYYLGFPNREVESAFNTYLLDDFTNVAKEHAASKIAKLSRFLKSRDIDSFFEELNTFFANIPYDLFLKFEKYYQTVFYIIFRMLGLRVDVEIKTSVGRIVAVIKTEAAIYIFEFKLDKSAEEALQQIKDKKYYAKYLDSDKEIILIGANFSTKEHEVQAYIQEILSDIS